MRTGSKDLKDNIRSMNLMFGFSSQGTCPLNVYDLQVPVSSPELINDR